MVVLNVENLEKSYGAHCVFNGVGFTVEEGKKVGIIGRNGAGKSTLVRMLAGEEAPDDGSIVFSNQARVEFLSQRPDLDESMTAIEVVCDDASSDIFALVRDYENACARLAESSDDEALVERVAKLQDAMDQNDGWTVEADARSILSRLGIEDRQQKIATMSGGQRKRVALARALLRPSALLILDEPTNHLDVDTIEWLESYLASMSGALMLITHDRYFLDRVANVILEIADNRIYKHDGNYSFFVEQRARRLEEARIAHHKQKQLAKKELEWLRRGPKARTTKARYRVESAQEAIETAKQGPSSVVQRALDDDSIDMVGSRLGKKIILAEGISKSYGDHTVLKDVTYRVTRDDRLGIVGPNGAGKTTLLNLLVGRLEPDSGTVEIGETVKFGYYDQESEELDGEQRVFDYVVDISNRIETSDGYLSASQMLERFGFARGDQHVFIKTLSGGEKRRLYLLRTLMAQPNVIVLDEPTNDLDVDTLTVLEDFLDGFGGVLLVVSHDRYFLDRTVDHLLVVSPDASVVEFPGNYSHYAEAQKRKAESAESVPQEVSTKEHREVPSHSVEKPRASSGSVEASKPKLSYKEQREYEQLEARIAEIESRLPQLDEAMTEHAADFERLKELSQERAELASELDEGLERWMELAERV